jgi:carboxylesterase type B
MSSVAFGLHHFVDEKLTTHQIGHHLLHNPSKPPPFQKVILESGAATARAVYTPSNPLHEKQFLDFLTKLGCEDIHEEHVMQALRYLTSNQIKEASEAVFNFYDPSVRWPFQPVIDGPGGFIEQAPIDAWREGKWHKVSILTGFNTNEGARFVPASTSTGRQFTKFFRTLLPGLSDKDLAELNEMYPDPLIHPSSKYRETRTIVGPQFKRIEQAYGHFAYAAPVRHTAHFASTSDAPVYLYHFAVSSSVKGGADHGTHVAFPTYSQEVRDISDTIDEITGSMHAYWTSFITTGDPNKIRGRFPKRPVWPAYRSGKEPGKLVMFGEGNDEIAGGDSEGVAMQIVDDTWAVEECEYWWNRTKLSEL